MRLPPTPSDSLLAGPSGTARAGSVARRNPPSGASPSPASKAGGRTSGSAASSIYALPSSTFSYQILFFGRVRLSLLRLDASGRHQIGMAFDHCLPEGDSATAGLSYSIDLARPSAFVVLHGVERLDESLLLHLFQKRIQGRDSRLLSCVLADLFLKISAAGTSRSECPYGIQSSNLLRRNSNFRRCRLEQLDKIQCKSS
jgi:hypothetical protein